MTRGVATSPTPSTTSDANYGRIDPKNEFTPPSISVGGEGSVYDVDASLPSSLQTHQQWIPSEPPARDRWSSRSAFLIAAIGSAVGIGNLWRFPFLSFRYGGGAFFLPYMLALFFVGIPVLQMEFALGQFFQGGHLVAFNGLTKRARGIGLAAPVSVYIVVVYYAAILGWSLIYLVASFQKNLPWAVTAEDAKLCPTYSSAQNCSLASMCLWNAELDECKPNVLSKAEGYFNDVLNVAASPTTSMTLRGSGLIVAGLAILWICIFFAIFKGAKMLGRIVYVTMVLPIVLLIIITIRGCTLPGASVGIKRYIGQWDFSILIQSPDVWSAAVGQIFFSVGVSYGVMTAYASFNRKYQNVAQDSFIVACSNSAVSIVAGFAVFAIAGFLATESGSTLDDLKSAGVGLAFWTFPTALSQLGSPTSQIFSILFFLMFFLLGVDSAFAMVEAFVTILTDSKLFRNISKLFIVLTLCLMGFLLSLPFATNIGIYLLDSVDYYVNNIATLFIGFSQCVVVGWLQGSSQQAQFIGWPSVILFDFSSLIGAVVGNGIGFGLSSHFDNTVLAIILGVGFAVLIWIVGFILSAFLFISTPTSEEAAITYGGKIWWLTLGNIEVLRRELNSIVASDSRCCGCSCPFFLSILLFPWSLLIKFVIPLTLLTLLSQNFASDSFPSYGNLPVGYQITGLILAFIPITIVLVGGLFPWTFAILTRKAEDESSLHLLDTFHPNLKNKEYEDSLRSPSCLSGQDERTLPGSSEEAVEVEDVIYYASPVASSLIHRTPPPYSTVDCRSGSTITANTLVTP